MNSANLQRGRLNQRAVQYLFDNPDLLRLDDLKIARALKAAGVYSTLTWLKGIEVGKLRAAVDRRKREGTPL